jgi:SnoaL-like domain
VKAVRSAALSVLALNVMLTACSASRDASAPAAASHDSTTSTTLPPRAFADAVRARDLNALTATFADDVQLYSPVLADPFVGRDRVSRLFAVLVATFQDIDIPHELVSEGHFVFSFHARVGTEPIEIVDLLDFDETGHIKTFTATARPLAGIQALAAAVSPHLAEIG